MKPFELQRKLAEAIFEAIDTKFKPSVKESSFRSIKACFEVVRMQREELKTLLDNIMSDENEPTEKKIDYPFQPGRGTLSYKNNPLGAVKDFELQMELYNFVDETESPERAARGFANALIKIKKERKFKK